MSLPWGLNVSKHKPISSCGKRPLCAKHYASHVFCSWALFLLRKFTRNEEVLIGGCLVPMYTKQHCFLIWGKAGERKASHCPNLLSSEVPSSLHLLVFFSKGKAQELGADPYVG